MVIIGGFSNFMCAQTAKICKDYAYAQAYTCHCHSSISTFFTKASSFVKGPGSIAQSAASVTEDQGPQPGHTTFVEIDHEIYFYGHSPHSTDSRVAVVSCWQKYVH